LHLWKGRTKWKRLFSKKVYSFSAEEETRDWPNINVFFWTNPPCTRALPESTMSSVSSPSKKVYFSLQEGWSNISTWCWLAASEYRQNTIGQPIVQYYYCGWELILFRLCSWSPMDFVRWKFPQVCESDIFIQTEVLTVLPIPWWFHLFIIRPYCMSCTAACFINENVQPLAQQFFAKRSKPGSEKLMLHMDNASAHTARMTNHFRSNRSLEKISQPLYAAYIVPRTFIFLRKW
jgi:hypothetical protein